MIRLPSIALACAVVSMAACSHPVARRVDACAREAVPEVPVAVQLLTARAATIEVHVRGSGAAIVLLPGTGGDASKYDTIAPILSAAGYRDAGHALLFEQPRRVADEVLDFLQDLDGHGP